MDNKLTTLNALEELVKEHKNKLLSFLESEFSINHFSSNYDSIFEKINELKDVEKEQARLDWKEGYIECCLDCADFFGNERDESYPTESEMEEIDKSSFEFVKRKFN
jgi:hypothetical protein